MRTRMLLLLVTLVTGQGSMQAHDSEATQARRPLRFRIDTRLDLRYAGIIDETQSVNRGTPIDFDHDGDLDFLAFPSAPGVQIGGNADAEPVPTVLLRNDDGVWVDATESNVSGVRSVSVQEVLVGDLNGDGWPDVYAADSGTDNPPFPGATNHLALGTKKGTLVQAEHLFATNPSGFTDSADLADADGDGSLDIYESNVRFGASLALPRLLFNDGKGGFAERGDALPATVAGIASENYARVRFADVDRDGDMDLVAGQLGFHDDLVLRNDGGGGFTVVPDALPQHRGFVTTDLRIGDFNGDGYPDVVIGSKARDWAIPEDTTSAIYLNRGDGTFELAPASWIPASVRTNLNAFRVADLNGDGLDDLIGMRFPAPHVLLLNKGGRRLKVVRRVFTGEEGGAVAASCCAAAAKPADFDGDGDIDLVYLDGVAFIFAENLTVDSREPRRRRHGGS